MTAPETLPDPTPTAGASSAAIRHHYDSGNDFFALWLDSSRTYSCALWDGPDDTLDAAQERKLDDIVGRAGAAGAIRVLDVGCGWGSMLRRLVDVHGVQQAVGLTLSPEQAAAIEPDPRYDVRVESWSDHEPEQPYDAIVSIGAFEHFADFGLGRAGRVEAYKAFFAACARWLPTGGRIGLQTITKGSNTKLTREIAKDLLFVADKIFPESEVPWPSELLESAERKFEVLRVDNHGDHYARTCKAWHEGLLAHREEAEAMVGAEQVADYDRYLRSCVDAFDGRHLGLLRTTFVKV